MSILDLGEREKKILLEAITTDVRDKGVLEAVTLLTDILGMMLFPRNKEGCEELETVTLAAVHTMDFARRLPHYPVSAASLPPAFFERLLRVNSEEVMARTAKEMGRGKAAGNLLWTIKRMCDAGYEGSVNKAVDFLEKRYETRAPEDEYMPTKRTGMRDAWQAFKPVAHLWAACRHGEILGFTPLHEFLTFLAYAECFRHFGMTHTARRQRGLPPILLPEETWTVPEGIPLPSVTAKMPPLTDEEKTILEDYRAPKML